MTTNTQTQAALFTTTNSAPGSKRDNTYLEPAALEAANFQAIAKHGVGRLTQKKNAARRLDLRFRGQRDGGAAIISVEGETATVTRYKAPELGQTSKATEQVPVAELEAKIVEIMTQVAGAEGIVRAKGSKSKAYAALQN